MGQPAYAVRDQVDAEHKSEHPKACHRKSREDNETGENSECAGRQPSGREGRAGLPTRGKEPGHRFQLAETYCSVYICAMKRQVI